MANRFAVASGNFNDTATWSTTATGAAGASVPVAGDNAIANNRTVTITADATCDNITNGTTYGGTAGGGFVLNDGVTLTVTQSILTGGTGGTIRLAGTNSATISAASIASANVANTDCILHSGSGTLTVNATTIQSNGLSANASRCINLTSSGTLSLTASTITGGGETVGTTGAILGGASSTLNINAATLTGGFAQSSPAVNANGGVCSITGNLVATTGCQAVTVISTSTLTVVGNVTAANGKNAIAGSPNNAIRVSGSFFYSSDGTPPTTQKLILNTTPSAAKTRYALNGAGSYVDMFTADNSLTQAAPADVRSGTVYADGNLTGTLAVPAAASVAFGVPVDNTTGTAVLTPAAVASAVWGAATRTITGGTVHTLVNAPSVPTPSQIASQVRTELTTELGRIDAAISTRATPANIPTSDITAIKAKTDALNTDRLAQVATTNIVGTLLAQANS